MSIINKKNKDQNTTINNYLSSKDIFENRNSTFYCKICKKEYNINKNSGISNVLNHENTKKHKKNLELHENYANKNMTSWTIDEFHMKFANMLVCANIAINVVDLPVVKEFFKAMFDIELQSAQSYRTRQIKELEILERKRIIESFENKPFAIYLDETTDPNGRNILNIFAKVLDDHNTQLFLVESREIEQTNASIDLFDSKVDRG